MIAKVITTIFTVYSCPHRWGEIAVNSCAVSWMEKCKGHVVKGDVIPCHIEGISDFWHRDVGRRVNENYVWESR